MNRSRFASRVRFAHSNLSLGPVIVVVMAITIRTRRSHLFLFIALFAACAGCSSDVRVDYVKSANNILGDLSAASDEFAVLLAPWMNGDEFDAEMMEAGLAKLRDTIDSVDSRLGSLAVPNDASCKRLSENLNEFMAFQHEVIEEIEAMVQTMERENPGSEQTRDLILEQLVKMNDEDVVWMKRLRDAAQGVN